MRIKDDSVIVDLFGAILERKYETDDFSSHLLIDLISIALLGR